MLFARTGPGVYAQSIALPVWVSSGVPCIVLDWLHAGGGMVPVRFTVITV
jgi:hypothetical protein